MTRTAIALAALLLGSAPAQAQVIDLTTSTPEAKSVTPPKLIANADVSAQADTGDQQGVVILTYDVGTDGKVTEVRLARAADSPLLNDVAVASALGRRYAPATRGGAPVAVRIATLIRFGAASAPADAPAPDQQTELDCNHGTHHIAIAACTALIDNPDGRPLDSLLLARARAYEMVGQYREAIADYDRLIAINDKAAAFYRARGFLHERLNEPGLAVADYNLALERNPMDQLTHFDRGAAELALRQASDAR
ncbi:MAG: energy transducer TonB, partial [Alphaproteobacteria bacterium]|nr:energy transducer TonB [Alphaproteobacteria bacterium]